MKLNEYGSLVIKDARDYADIVLETHRSIAFNENRAISASDTMTYKLSRMTLFAAIGIAYPETDIKSVYDIWVDCGENLAYCVEAYKNRNRGEADNTYVTVMEDMTDIVRNQGVSDKDMVQGSFYDTRD